MSTEAIVGIIGFAVSIGGYLAITRALEKRVTRLEDKLDRFATKSDFRGLKDDVRRHDGE